MGFGRSLGVLIKLRYHSCDAGMDVRGVVEGAGSLTQKVEETHLGRGSSSTPSLYVIQIFSSTMPLEWTQILDKGLVSIMPAEGYKTVEHTLNPRSS